MKSKIILASNSPRRREICEKYGLNPEILIPKIEEKIEDMEEPYEVVMALAFEKAYSIAKDFDDDIVIAADTIVYHNGKKLGKPSTMVKS